MDKASLIGLTAILGLVAGSVWLSDLLDHRPRATEAVAAAIKDEMAFFIEFFDDPAEREAVDGEEASLCIASEEPLDFTLLAARLDGTLLRAVPIADCTSKTVEGDFGMFSGMTYWFDASGEEAGMLEIAATHCPTSRRCIVDINSRGRGDRYEVTRSGGKWSVTEREMRWVI